MSHWLVGCTRFRAVVVVLTITLSEAASSGAIAQTLMEPACIGARNLDKPRTESAAGLGPQAGLRFRQP